MGLGISVGLLADLLVHDAEGAEWLTQQLDDLNGLLAKNGLPVFEEPRTMPELERRGVMSFPYSFLHYLRRAYACHRRDQPIPSGELTPEQEESISDYTVTRFDSHLLCHSDCEGFYVPVDFAEPIFDDAVLGGMLGSVQALQRELLAVAPKLGIEIDEEAPTPAAVDIIADYHLTVPERSSLGSPEREDPWFREKTVWLALWEACRVSVEHSTLVVFS